MEIAAAVVVAVVVIWAVWTFNRLVRLRNMAREAWSGVDVQLKRRYDLVPNLAEVVRQYSGHEQSVLTGVTQARGAAVQAAGVLQQQLAENALTDGLRALLAVVENYPDLKANENFMDLQRNLSAVEDDIQMARRYYNGTVRNLNNLVEAFPAMAVARAGGFRSGEFFEIHLATEREAPELELDAEGEGES